MTQRLPVSISRPQGRSGFVVLLAMTAVVMFTNDSEREYLKVAIGDVHLVERDFFLYGLLALLAMNMVVTGRAPRVGRFSACGLAVVALYYAGILNGLWHGNDPKQIFFHIRQVNYLLVCLPFVRFVNTPARLRVLLRTALTCVLAAAVLTILLAFHYADSDFVTRSEFFWITGGAHGQYFHIRMATAFFFVITLDVLLAMWVSKSRQFLQTTVLWMMALISLALVLTVLRSYWTGLVVSLLSFFILWKKRLRFLVVGLFLSGIAAFLLSVFFADSQIGRFVQEQIMSSFDPDSVAVSDRMNEQWVGTEAIKLNPWFGGGVGTTIVITMRSIGQTIETSFCHDSLLTMLLFFGITGFSVLVGVFAVLFRRGRRLSLTLAGNEDPLGAALATGCLAGLMGLIATSFTAAAINYATGFFLVGAVLGIFDVLSSFADSGVKADE